MSILEASCQESGIFPASKTEANGFCNLGSKINLNVLENSEVKPSGPGALLLFNAFIAVMISLREIGELSFYLL